MTLIIGSKFRDGVILVADRAVTEGTKLTHELKIESPYPSDPMFFGAAGYSHKFKQFNRKILERVAEKIRTIDLQNRAYYHQLGLKYPEKIEASE
jgi:hypothetical protein